MNTKLKKRRGNERNKDWRRKERSDKIERQWVDTGRETERERERVHTHTHTHTHTQKQKLTRGKELSRALGFRYLHLLCEHAATISN